MQLRSAAYAVAALTCNMLKTHIQGIARECGRSLSSNWLRPALFFAIPAGNKPCTVQQAQGPPQVCGSVGQRP